MTRDDLKKIGNLLDEKFSINNRGIARGLSFNSINSITDADLQQNLAEIMSRPMSSQSFSNLRQTVNDRAKVYMNQGNTAGAEQLRKLDERLGALSQIVPVIHTNLTNLGGATGDVAKLMKDLAGLGSQQLANLKRSVDAVLSDSNLSDKQKVNRLDEITMAARAKSALEAGDREEFKRIYSDPRYRRVINEDAEFAGSDASKRFWQEENQRRMRGIRNTVEPVADSIAGLAGKTAYASGDSVAAMTWNAFERGVSRFMSSYADMSGNGMGTGGLMDLAAGSAAGSAAARRAATGGAVARAAGRTAARGAVRGASRWLPVVGGVVDAGFTAYDAVSSGEDNTTATIRAITSGVASTVGGILGGIGGSFVAPGVGTTVGAIGGATAFGAGGDRLGSWLARLITGNDYREGSGNNPADAASEALGNLAENAGKASEGLGGVAGFLADNPALAAGGAMGATAIFSAVGRGALGRGVGGAMLGNIVNELRAGATAAAHGGLEFITSLYGDAITKGIDMTDTYFNLSKSFSSGMFRGTGATNTGEFASFLFNNPLSQFGFTATEIGSAMAAGGRGTFLGNASNYADMVTGSGVIARELGVDLNEVVGSVTSLRQAGVSGGPENYMSLVRSLGASRSGELNAFSKTLTDSFVSAAKQVAASSSSSDFGSIIGMFGITQNVLKGAGGYLGALAENDPSLAINATMGLNSFIRSGLTGSNPFATGIALRSGLDYWDMSQGLQNPENMTRVISQLATESGLGRFLEGGKINRSGLNIVGMYSSMLGMDSNVLRALFESNFAGTLDAGSATSILEGGGLPGTPDRRDIGYEGLIEQRVESETRLVGAINSSIRAVTAWSDMLANQGIGAIQTTSEVVDLLFGPLLDKMLGAESDPAGTVTTRNDGGPTGARASESPTVLDTMDYSSPEYMATLREAQWVVALGNDAQLVKIDPGRPGMPENTER